MGTKTDDQLVMDDILDRLNRDPRVDAAQVKVDITRHGTATLRGTVHSFQARRAAQEAAASAEGVRRVHNFLVVPLPDPADLTGVRAYGDEGVLARVNQYLRGQDILEDERIDVTAADGIVTLEGSVNAYWKKRRTGEVVLGVEGVAGVVNHLAVVPTSNPADDVIAGNIMDDLEANFLVDPQTVDVKVNDGLVTLRGTVPGPEARREAFLIALHTEGVADVRDEMRIEAAP